MSNGDDFSASEWKTDADSDLKSLGEQLWREYELVESKIDSATRFRMVITGWTLTSASAIPFLLAVSKLGTYGVVAATAFAIVLLMVIHKLGFDQLDTGLRLGSHAQLLEREIATLRKLRRKVRLTNSDDFGDRAAGSRAPDRSAESSSRSADRRGVKRTAGERLVRSVRRKLGERHPSMARISTPPRMTFRQFLGVAYLLPPRWAGDTRASGAEQEIVATSGQTRGAVASRSERNSQSRASDERKIRENLRSHLWILYVQLAFLIVGGGAVTMERIWTPSTPTSSGVSVLCEEAGVRLSCQAAAGEDGVSDEGRGKPETPATPYAESVLPRRSSGGEESAVDDILSGSTNGYDAAGRVEQQLDTSGSEREQLRVDNGEGTHHASQPRAAESPPTGEGGELSN